MSSLTNSVNAHEEQTQTTIAMGDQLSSFNFPEPRPSVLQRELSLWSTYYIVYQTTQAQGEDTVPLLGPNYQPLGIELSHRDWCFSALQGTVRILEADGRYHTYNFVQRGELEQVDCSQYFSSLTEATLQKMSRNLFRPVNSPYGDGTNGYILMPYRTIAVDPNFIPLGTLIYIPAARGVEITLSSGQRVRHDGYFFAADVGSAIKGNKIDTFIGTSTQNPFPHVLSTQTGTFRAFIVNDPTIRNTLTRAHRP